MIVCGKCGGNCDSGETISGICLDCLKQEQQKLIRESRIIRIMNSPFNQMELNLEEIKNGK